MLSKEEHKALLDSLQVENADVGGICLALYNNYDEAMAAAVPAEDPGPDPMIAVLQAENAMLRKNNSELFLLVGVESEPEKPEEPEEPKPVTYEDLGL